jgi:HK97 family phage major capsid protein
LTQRELRKLKDTQNRYLWEFNNQVGQPPTIGGYPVVEMPELVAPAANGTFTTGDQPIIFGDFKKGYKIVDGMGIVTTRDNLTDYPNIVYKMKKRSGGGLVKGECIKKLKMV